MALVIPVLFDDYKARQLPGRYQSEQCPSPSDWGSIHVCTVVPLVAIHDALLLERVFGSYTQAPQSRVPSFAMQFTCTTIRLRLSAVGSAADSLLANMIVFVWQRLYLTVQQRLHAVI